MSNFEELLSKTVRGLGKSYTVAETDLIEQAELASEGVQRVTSGIARLALQKESEDPEKTEFTLYVSGDDQLSAVTTFMIPMTGYPIKAASDMTYARLGVYDRVLENKGDLSTYFDQLASNPDSRLALRIAFLLRKAKVEQSSKTGEKK